MRDWRRAGTMWVRCLAGVCKSSAGAEQLTGVVLGARCSEGVRCSRGCCV